MNRCSYCFNNPLNRNDPTGKWPNFAGIFKNVVNTVKAAVNTVVDAGKAVVEKVNETKDNVKQAALNAVGIERVEYYTDTRSIKDPVPVYHIGDTGIVPTLYNAILGNNTLGVSLYPIGAFVKESALPQNPELVEHESKHYSEQRDWGLLWYIGYGIEVGARDFWYWDTYWGYKTSSFEQRACDYAGEKSDSPPTPWLLDPQTYSDIYNKYKYYNPYSNYGY